MTIKFGPPKQTIAEKRQTTSRWKQRKKEAGFTLIQIYLPRETMQKIQRLYNTVGKKDGLSRLVQILSRAVDLLYDAEFES